MHLYDRVQRGSGGFSSMIYCLELFLAKALKVHNFAIIIIMCQQFFKHLSIFQLLMDFLCKHQYTIQRNFPKPLSVYKILGKIPIPLTIKIPRLPPPCIKYPKLKYISLDEIFNTKNLHLSSRHNDVDYRL